MRKLPKLFAVPFLGLGAWLALSCPAMAATAPVITEFPTPTVNSEPNAIALGPDGALWFTELSGSGIGRITAGASPTIAEFTISGGASSFADA